MSFSILIITHRREELLWKCLSSLMPRVEDWQLVLVANGDKVSEELQNLARRICQNVEMIELPSTVTPGKARNEGLKFCTKEWVFFLDDDAYLPSDYFQRALPQLENSQIDILGGPDAPAPGMNAFGLALGIALSSPLCTGATFARHFPSNGRVQPASVDHLSSCNLWIRRALLNKNFFPENYSRTEEVALLMGLEKQGAKMFYSSGLKVWHHRRRSLLAVLRPTFYSGYFRSVLMKEMKSSGQLIFYLPSLFVVLHLILLLDLESFLLLGRFYLAAVSAISISLIASYKRWFLLPLVIFLHWFIVFVYGLGFLSHRLGIKWK